MFYSDSLFRYQGQYEDQETGLYYNRFRYYSPKMGGYLSQDPIGLAGNNPTLYGYVRDVNSWVDILGLDVATGADRTHITYQGMKYGKDGVARPYTGYASAPNELELSSDDILKRRYNNDLSDFVEEPVIVFTGKGIDGKNTARRLEQKGYELDVSNHN